LYAIIASYLALAYLNDSLAIARYTNVAALLYPALLSLHLNPFETKSTISSFVFSADYPSAISLAFITLKVALSSSKI
jgi:hypothetical protein